MRTQIENSIKYLTAIKESYVADPEHLSVAIETMDKYLKIEQIIANKGYWSDKRLLNDIKEVLEDGNDT